MLPSHKQAGGRSGRVSPISYRQAFWLLEPELSTRIFIVSVIVVLRCPDDQGATEPPNAEVLQNIQFAHGSLNIDRSAHLARMYELTRTSRKALCQPSCLFQEIL